MNRLRFAVLVAALAPVLLIGGLLRLATRQTNWRVDGGVTVLFHKILCAALGLRVRVSGRLASPGALIAANHVSWLDIPALGALQPVAFLAKSELGRRWPGRTLARLQGVVFVERRRRRCIPMVNREIARILARGAPLALFAEATTGDGNRLLRFRSSHFEALRGALDAGQAEAVVQPAHIAYVSRNGLPIGRVGQPVVAWYGDMTFAPHLWRLVRDGPFDCEITFGEPIRFFRMSNRKEIAALAQAGVRKLATGRRSHGLQQASEPVGPARFAAAPGAMKESLV